MDLIWSIARIASASIVNEGQFFYELKIPFADIGGKIADANQDKKRQVAIGVQIGGMTEAEMEFAQATMREKMGESGGRGSGGMGGGAGGSSASASAAGVVDAVSSTGGTAAGSSSSSSRGIESSDGASSGR